MRKHTLHILLFVLLTACSFSKTKEEKDKIPIFFSANEIWMKENIKLWINDNLVYDGTFRSGYKSSFPSDMLLAYINKGNHLEKIKIEVGNTDTIFNYSINRLDSILIAHNKYEEPHFFIWSNLDKRIWVDE